MMGSPSSILKLAVLLLSSITSAYPPTCNPFFGSPNERHCDQLIHGPFNRPPSGWHGSAFLSSGIRNIDQVRIIRSLFFPFRDAAGVLSHVLEAKGAFEL